MMSILEIETEYKDVSQVSTFLQVSYSVDDARFTVSADGVVQVTEGASFDYEGEPSIDIVVTATSADGSTSSQAFTLSVDDVAENLVLSSGDDVFMDMGVTELSLMPVMAMTQ